MLSEKSLDMRYRDAYDGAGPSTVAFSIEIMSGALASRNELQHAACLPVGIVGRPLSRDGEKTLLLHAMFSPF